MLNKPVTDKIPSHVSRLTSNNIAISVKNLTKIYKLYDKNIDRLKESLNPLGKKYHRDFYALKDVSFEVRKGEVLGIVGKNGSGKSTLVSIISGVLSPSSGKVNTRGRISPLLGLESGFNPELTGIENVYFYGTIRGYSKEEMDLKVKEILSFAEIGDFIYQPIKVYSSGMKARLSFAVAINIDPEILIVDEVLAVGDELFRRKCYTKMEELFESGCTVLFVSHSMSSVHQICTRAILLDLGEQILEGPPKFVTMHYLKYLYAKPVNRNAIRKEIIQLNRDEARKVDFAASLAKTESKTTSKDGKKGETVHHEIKKGEPTQKAFYLPELKPRSTIVSKEFDVDISDIFIKTLTGEKVNALVLNEEYVLHYKIKFNVPAEDVTFGLSFKTGKGLGISGARIPGKYEYIERVKKGDIFLVEVHFRSSFLPRSYFINLDVKGRINGEEQRLTHINDALIFTVQDISDSSSIGMVQLIEYADIRKFQSKKDSL